MLSLTSNSSVMVAQYMKKYEANNPYRGDASMLIVQPNTWYVNHVTFPVFNYTRSINHTYYVNVIIQCDYVDGLLFDGLLLNVDTWDQLTAPDDSSCCLRNIVSPGHHSISSTNLKARFSVSVYAIAEDFGSSYTYQAQVFHLQDTVTTEMPPTEKPPVVLVVQQAATTELEVSWKRYQTDARIQHFRVTYNKGNSLNLEEAVTIYVNGTQRAITLSDLAPNTPYYIKIEAYTEDDTTLNVGELRAMTLPDKSPEFPLVLVIAGASGGLILLLVVILMIVCRPKRNTSRRQSTMPLYVDKNTMHDLKEGTINPVNNDADPVYEVPPPKPKDFDNDSTYEELGERNVDGGRYQDFKYK
ncbi:uncharacterized protein [Amphiura filiformis]|uniref:uncharacterized protein n=1 Tax=Amphiura filiformis TaxID=82378 RepID=UPI003B213392